MAAFYELRYWKNFEQPDGSIIRLEIHSKGIEGVSFTAYEIGPVVQALALTIQGQTEDVDAPIVKTSLTMTFVDAPDHADSVLKKCGDWEEFYTNDSTYWKVLIKAKKDPSSASYAQLWGGYVTPDSFSEELRYRGSVTIVARDNIGHMQDFPFDAEGDENGLISLKELVETAWAKIESPMTLYWPALRWLQCEGVYAFDTRMNVSAFKDMNWYEAVEKALYSYGAVMRYNGENQVLLCPLRYMPQQARPSMDQVNHIEPIFVANAQRELVPAVRRIEETVEYDLSEAIQPLVELSDFSGATSEVKDATGFTARVYDIINLMPGHGWVNPSSDPIYFNPAVYTLTDAEWSFPFTEDEKEQLPSSMMLLCNNKEGEAIYSRYVHAVDCQFKIGFGNRYVVNGPDTNQLYKQNQDYCKIIAVNYSVRVTKDGITHYLQENGEWGVPSATLTISSNTHIGQITIAVPFKEAGNVLLELVIKSIELDQTLYNHYVVIHSLTLENLSSAPLLKKNTVNTRYQEQNNVIITRNPEFAPAYNVTALPGFIKNGIFYYDGNVIMPAKAWSWNEGTPHQMAVYNHLQLLCYHSKPNNLITGDIVNADVIKTAAIYVWGGKEHLLISGTYNYLNGRIEGAVLREFVRYDDMWGEVSGTSLPDTEQSSTTNQEGGGASSGPSSTNENTTNVVIGGEGGGSVTIDPFLSDTSSNPVESKAIKAYIDSADNEIKERLAALEEGSDVDHPVFEFVYDESTNKATAEMVAALAEAIAADKLILCNGRTYKFILEQDGMYGLVSDTYLDILDGKLKASVLAVMSSSYDVQLAEQEVPVGTEITETTIRNWGFTKNVGTITGIMMNGATKGTSGVVNLGNVLTEHQKLKTINNQSILGEGNITIQSGGATPRVEMTAASAAIEPNKFYVWGDAERLNLTLAEGKADELNRYMFQFKTPSSAYTILQLPDDIIWSDDTKVDADGMPVIELSAYHRVEIIDGLATLRRWRIVSRYIVFADPEVEKVLLANGIGDGAGVTKKAAAALTTLYGEFAHNELITSFDEFSLFGVTTINGAPSSEGGFCGCTNLKSIVLPETLEVMYDGAVPGQYLSTGVFKDCESLKRITIPSKVTAIPTSAFYNCISLKNVEFKGDIKSIGAYAFALCENLSVNIPSSVEYINDFAFRDAPMTDAVIDCPNLRELSGIDVFTHSELKSAKSLGNITTLTFQNDPPSYYGRYPSFYGCTKLEEVNLPETLMHIGRNMFQGCASLRNVTIPHKITELYTGTFYGCDSLEWVKLMPNTPPTLGSVDCFDETASYLFYVPDDSVEAYKTAGNWNSYARRIKGMSEFVMDIVCPSSIKGDSMVISAINVTGDLTWSIQNGSDYATITKDGYLEILPTASNSPVTIRCTQSDGNYVEKIVNVTYNAALMYLPFDADFVDAKGNATLQNVSECNIDSSKGKRGASMHRPNTYGGLAYAPNFNASFSAKSFTIDVWVYLPSSAPLSYLGIAGKRTNAGMGASWSVGINQRRVNIGLSASGAGFTNDFYTEAVIPYNRWTRVTIIRDVDKGEIRVYVNTELVATFSMTYALFDGTDGLAVGNYHTDTSNDYFVGNLDEFYLYEGCIFE